MTHLNELEFTYGFVFFFQIADQKIMKRHQNDSKYSLVFIFTYYIAF